MSWQFFQSKVFGVKEIRKKSAFCYDRNQNKVIKHFSLSEDYCGHPDHDLFSTESVCLCYICYITNRSEICQKLNGSCIICTKI